MNPYFPSDFSPDDFPGSMPFSRPGPPLAADEDLALRVADRLRADLTGPAHRITVEVQNRVVIVEGVVATSAIRSQVHHLVWDTPGVADVCNRLTTWDEERHTPAGR